MPRIGRRGRIDEALRAAFPDERDLPPPAYVLAVRGEAFDLGGPLSEATRRNLAAASAFLARLVGKPRPEAWQALAVTPSSGTGPKTGADAQS
jgi:hypothetical protein